jgi:hypothetical protein
MPAYGLGFMRFESGRKSSAKKAKIAVDAKKAARYVHRSFSRFLTIS